MNSKVWSRLARQLSLAVINGEPTQVGIRESLGECLGVERSARTQLEPLVREIHSVLKHNKADCTQLHAHLLKSPALELLSLQRKLQIVKWPLYFAQQTATTGPMRWGVPPVGNEQELARFLKIEFNDLTWLSGRYKNLCHEGKRSHYHYRQISKANGSFRLLEIPKPRLKEIQRSINSNILARIPNHKCAHAFIKGRSIKSFADAHVKKTVVLTVDLSDFYASVPAGRVFKLFEFLGYDSKVSALLASLCLNSASYKSINGLPSGSRALYLQPHLPQGAPTSPALANLTSFNLDVRLHALARKFGFDYTRYADDLAFSAYDKCSINSFLRQVKLIVKEVGFKLNDSKTRVQTPARSQRLCGLVVNEKLNLPREKIKQLEAELYNCARFGAASQNFMALDNYKQHLQGRLSEVWHCAPHKAERLQNFFERINWQA